MPDTALVTFALESYARRAFNYLDQMVDSDGLPYFNVFWEEPAEAAHDWPDFGDVMTRSLQGAVMARSMTGQESTNEKRWLQKVLAYIDPATGLLTRPRTSYSTAVADLGDYALTLYALVTVYDAGGDPAIAGVVRRMVDAFPLVKSDNSAVMSFAIKGLMAAGRSLGYQPAIDHARECVDLAMRGDPILQEDNTYPRNGHMHLLTRGLVGIADYALYAGDAVLYSRVDAAYRSIRSLDPGFGFLPEVVDRQGDVIACETCALMDYIGLGVTLANNGHPEYWGGIERVVRNHLVESQAADTTWLRSDPQSRDTPQLSHREVGERMVGAFAGWSSPTHLLAVREELHWGGGSLRGKTRAFQNCCGGSGTHAFYIAWKNASRFCDGVLAVNLHIDKLLPQAEVRGYQPYRGLLTVDLKTACDVRVRIPDSTCADEVRLKRNGRRAAFTASGNFLEVTGCRAGDLLEVEYPLPTKTEIVTIGNKRPAEKPAPWYTRSEQRPPEVPDAFHQYSYRVTWKGDTVVAMEPVGEMPDRGYSDYDKRKVEIFYGEEGPGRLYLRDRMRADAVPRLTELHLDTSPIDYWRLR